MNQALRQNIEAIIDRYASNSLRTLAFAFKDMNFIDQNSACDEKDVYDIEKSDLTFFCILGIQDTLRPGVKEAVKKCQNAGIKVRMITGDNKATAKAIALDCGIIDVNELREPDVAIMEGEVFMEAIGGIICKKCRTPECNCPRNREEAEKLEKPMRVDTIRNEIAFDSIYPRLNVLARSQPMHKLALVIGLMEREQNVVAVRILFKKWRALK